MSLFPGAWKRDNLGSEMGDWIKSEENSVTSAIFSHFHFVDLAGSERASKTGNKGERFKGQLKEIHVV